jgi:hypothetical protein
LGDVEDGRLDKLEQLEHYLATLETEMKNDETKTGSFKRFFDLPAELRGLIYEHVAADVTIRLEEVASWREWPSICIASRRIYNEALPFIYRYAAFEARVRRLDFPKLIHFTETLPPTCLGAMSCNNRITILFDALPCLEAIQMYSLLQPWPSLCWSLAANGNDIRWLYAAVLPNTLDWRLIYVGDTSATLYRSGYYDLKDVYAMIEDDRMKDEIAGMLLAVQSSAKYTNLLVAELG